MIEGCDESGRPRPFPGESAASDWLAARCDNHDQSEKCRSGPAIIRWRRAVGNGREGGDRGHV